MTATFNPKGISAILMGDESLTIACGDMILAGGHHLSAVVTRDTAVSVWAEGKGLPVLAAPRDLDRRWRGGGLAAQHRQPADDPGGGAGPACQKARSTFTTVPCRDMRV